MKNRRSATSPMKNTSCGPPLRLLPQAQPVQTAQPFSQTHPGSKEEHGTVDGKNPAEKLLKL